jgi:hypothetical protein
LIHAFAIATVLLSLTASHASAVFVISLSNVNLAPGGTGTMDIYVTSTTAYTLSDFSLGLQIRPVGNPTSLLQFSMTQPTPTFGSASYVFAGQSFDQDFGIPYWGLPTTTSYPKDTITGGDSADSTVGAGFVSIGASLSTFIGAVQFTAPMGATAGDQFQISLINSGLTEFDDENGNPLSITFPSTGGVVTITPSVVPEPSSLVITLTGLGGLLGAWGLRRVGKSLYL